MRSLSQAAPLSRFPEFSKYYFFSLSNLDFALLLLTAVPLRNPVADHQSERSAEGVHSVNTAADCLFPSESGEHRHCQHAFIYARRDIRYYGGAHDATAVCITQEYWTYLSATQSSFGLFQLYPIWPAPPIPLSVNLFRWLWVEAYQGQTLADQEVARWLRSHTGTDKRVMADDATTYRVIAFHGRSEEFVLPMENDFITYLSNPEMASYILVPAAENMFRRF